MNNFKSIKNFIVNFLNLIRWFFIQVKNENFVNYISSSNNENNIVVLGSGPSLFEDLGRIENLDNCKYLAVNDFITSKLFCELKPNYYVLADPGYFDKDCDNILVVKTINLLSKVEFQVQLFIPFIYYKMFIKNNPNILDNNYLRISPFHTNEYYGFERVNFFLYKAGLSMPLVQNILIAAVFISINLGYKNVYLLGADHSWLYDLRVNLDNRVCQYKRHFYNSEESNQMEPFFKSPGVTYKMHEILVVLSRTFYGYLKLENYSKKRNARVINVTKNSYIDAFERFQ